jgi:surface antigen
MATSPDNSIGKVLAKLDSPVYTAAGGDRFSHGQCTWYACGRAKEKYKVDISALLPAPANGGDWYSKIKTTSKVTKLPPTSAPVTDSIASFAHGECGHVVFIEAVRPGWVYFTEYNWDQSKNGKLQKASVKDFTTLHGCKLNGYIVIR